MRGGGTHARLTTGAGKRLEKEFIVPDCSSTWCTRADFPEPLLHWFISAAESQTQKATFLFFLYVSFICILQPSPRYLNGKGTRERARGGEGHIRKGLEAHMGGWKDLPALWYRRDFNNMTRIWTFCSIVLYVLNTKSLAQSSQTCNNYQKLDHNFSPHILSICGIRRTYGFMVSQK